MGEIDPGRRAEFRRYGGLRRYGVSGATVFPALRWFRRYDRTGPCQIRNGHRVGFGGGTYDFVSRVDVTSVSFHLLTSPMDKTT